MAEEENLNNTQEENTSNEPVENTNTDPEETTNGEPEENETPAPEENVSGKPETVTHAERMVAAIEAVLEGRATDEYKSIKINNREITKHSFDELRRLRDYYRAEVARIKARRRKTFKSIGYRF